MCNDSPEGLKEVFITGGIPPSVKEPTRVYERTYGKSSVFTPISPLQTDMSNTERTIERNEAYYNKYPEDIPKVRRICQYLHKTNPKVGSGYLSARRFQQLGIMLGMLGKPVTTFSPCSLILIRVQVV